MATQIILLQFGDKEEEKKVEFLRKQRINNTSFKKD